MILYLGDAVRLYDAIQPSGDTLYIARTAYHVSCMSTGQKGTNWQVLARFRKRRV